MRIATLSILLAAGAAFASAANAQAHEAAPPVGTVYPGQFEPQWAGDPVTMGPVTTPSPYRAGFTALDTENFAEAEKIFARFVERSPRSGSANFFLGVSRMDLGKWEDAKKPLEIAARKIPEHPDPKSRLGVTYARLGDIAGANAQRADLVKMSKGCKGSCRLSPYIVGGIEMIDEALAETPASTPQG